MGSYWLSTRRADARLLRFPTATSPPACPRRDPSCTRANGDRKPSCLPYAQHVVLFTVPLYTIYQPRAPPINIFKPHNNKEREGMSLQWRTHTSNLWILPQLPNKSHAGGRRLQDRLAHREDISATVHFIDKQHMYFYTHTHSCHVPEQR